MAGSSKTRAWWAIVVVVVGGLLTIDSLWRSVAGVHSLNRALAVSLLYVVVIGLFGAGFWLSGALGQRRLRRLKARHPDARVWAVSSIVYGRALSAVLMVDHDTISFQRGRNRQVWPRKELRNLSETTIRVGLVTRRVLQLQFGVEQPRAEKVIIFSRRWVLTDDAATDAAKQALRPPNRKHAIP